MSENIILVLIAFIIICLIVTVVWFILYSGLFSEVNIKTGSPPIRNVTIAYKFQEGPYKDVGALYTETCSIGPKLNCIGVFYDDPDKRPPEKCRCVVGSILSEGEEKPDEEVQKLYEKFGFKVFSMPEVPLAVTSTFPCTTPLSHIIGPYRVYRELADYIKDRDLLARPYIETYKGDLIHYMVPLSRWLDFFVPEMTEEAKKLKVEEDSDSEDRGTDITGAGAGANADSHSDVTLVSGELPSESGETSLAPPTATAPFSLPFSSSLPPRDQGDGDEQGEHKDLGDRVSTESVTSGSSFEELDLEQVDDQEREEERERKEESPTAEDGAIEPPQDAAAEEREPMGDGEE